MTIAATYLIANGVIKNIWNPKIVVDEEKVKRSITDESLYDLIFKLTRPEKERLSNYEDIIKEPYFVKYASEQ